MTELVTGDRARRRCATPVRGWLAYVVVLAAVLAGCADTENVDAGGRAGPDGPPMALETTLPVLPTTTVAPDQPVATSEPPIASPTTPGPRPTAAPPAPPTTSTPPSTPTASGNRHPAGWESFEVGADGRTLVFTYYAGIAPCSVFDSIDAVEGPSQVTVTIYERSDAGPEVACIAIAQRKLATVTLGAPLSGRTVVDGGR